jgi:cystathionine gamma-synthase
MYSGYFVNILLEHAPWLRRYLHFAEKSDSRRLNMIITVSKSPPGGRCTLYARYAEAVSRHFGLTVDIHCPGNEPRKGPPPPAIVIQGLVVEPFDGVIVAPEDIVAVLAKAGLCDRLDDYRAELERIQDDFLTEQGV